MLDTLVVIEAKAENSRLPGKHRMDVGGQPLFKHAVWNTIESTRGMGNVVVAVSTNDSLCVDIAEKYRLPNIERPPILFTDDLPHQEWADRQIRNYTEWWLRLGGTEPFKFVILGGNMVVFRIDIVQRLCEMLDLPNTAKASVMKSGGEHHPRGAYVRDNNDGVVPWMDSDSDMARTNKWEPVLYGAGYGKAMWLPERSGINRPLEVGRNDVVHVHDEDDMELARALYAFLG